MRFWQSREEKEKNLREVPISEELRIKFGELLFVLNVRDEFIPFMQGHDRLKDKADDAERMLKELDDMMKIVGKIVHGEIYADNPDAWLLQKKTSS